MGDNRDESADSAYHATRHDTSPFVPVREVTGQAILISWPFSRWSSLNSYSPVFQNVPKTK
jgi:signal peptidase I